MNTEKEIIEKIKRVEALFLGTNIEGEKNAAELALQRLQKKLDELKKIELPEEYQFSLADKWSRKLFVSVLRKYGVKPYRYPRQRHTTVMARGTKTVIDMLWKEYQELNLILVSYLEDVSDRVIRECFNSDTSDAEVVSNLTPLS